MSEGALHDAASIREADRAAIAAGTPAVVLMERAGSAVAATVRVRYPHVRRVAVLCGGGNNGGDGLVAARHLGEAGIEATCFLTSGHGDAASTEGSLSAALAGAELVIDAMLGTGASGAPRADVAAAIETIASTGLPVVSVDVPSGVDASTGEVATVAVLADVTVTFHAAKLGIVISPGRGFAGEVVVADIGLPADAPAPGLLAGSTCVAQRRRRSRLGSKYDAGSVVTVGGSIGLTGAIALASSAALRAGAGIVTAAVPASLNAILELKLTEAMTLPCPDDAGHLTAAAAQVILERTMRAGAVVVGPGIGRDAGTQALVRALTAAIDAPLVLDADALHALSVRDLAGRQAPTVVTPHAGEAAALLGSTRGDVDRSRLAAARAIATEGRVVCVLKGADTIITGPDGALAVRDGDDPGLATAGSGDVLAGVIGALLAAGNAPFDAACIGAAAHLAAARSARGAWPDRAIIASDLVERLSLG